MHSAFVRATVVAFFALSVLMLAAISCTVISAWTDDHSAVDVRSVSAELRGLAADRREDADTAHLVVSVDADFSRLWRSWNTRQVFVYAVAEHVSKGRMRNEAVVWDRIIKSEEDAVVSVKDQGKYLLLCDDDELRGAEINVTLRWDVHPIVGGLGSYEHKSEPFTIKMPDEYTHVYGK